MQRVSIELLKWMGLSSLFCSPPKPIRIRIVQSQLSAKSVFPPLQVMCCCVSVVIGSLSASSGPAILRSELTDDCLADFFVKYFVSDHGLSHDMDFKCSWMTKHITFPQTNSHTIGCTFREDSDGGVPDHLIPTYCFIFVMKASDDASLEALRSRMMMFLHLWRERLSTLLSDALNDLRDGSETVVSLPESVISIWWEKLVERRRDLQLWIFSVVSRSDVAQVVETSSFLPLDVSAASRILTAALANRHVVLRSGSTLSLTFWMSLILLFASDDKLLASTLTIRSKHEIVRGLFLQGTTCELSQGEVEMLQDTQFRVTLIDLDRIEDAHHYLPPRLSQYQKTKNGKVRFSSLASSSESVAEIVSQLCRVTANWQSYDQELRHSVVRNVVEPLLTNWRQKQQILSCRQAFADTYPSLSLPMCSDTEADVLYNVPAHLDRNRIAHRNAVVLCNRFDGF